MCFQFGSGNPTLEGYTNSDMSADVDTNISTSRYVMTNTGVDVSFQLMLQKVVALLTTKVEYMVVAEASEFIGELGIHQEEF